ncbi:AAA family ATPase [Photobacterium sp. Hal280]|uniref:AAA family ATPase n=1 Tax=Photobacterium sp. Hal280 TaxID=3035163 RepID=UPI00301BC02E
MSSKVTLSQVVDIAPYYQKSIRLTDDLNNSDALGGYVCLETAKKLLFTMSQQIVNTNQRAFTWTGPFGSGKSSLALALASLLRKNEVSENIHELALVEGFQDAFPKGGKGWLIIPVVGSRSSSISAISQAIQSQTGISISTQEELFSTLRNLSLSHDGLLLIIDEMGKLLEGTEQQGDDIYFFQELAEFVSRAKSNMVLIGILHQSFRQYAKHQNFSEKIQYEWEKVQGRFSDIPLVTSSDESIELIGKAIKYNGSISEKANEVCFEVASFIKTKRYSINDNFQKQLKECWPIHPVTAMMLGPASKRQYGQNERSVFGFLSSLETFGFQYFMRLTEDNLLESYTPDMYWDYLKENLEPSIIASTDSQRWVLANSSIERAIQHGNKLHVSLTKSISVIDLFKNGTGLCASTSILETICLNYSQREVQNALQELEEWKIIVFRRFNDAWSVFEGSDFDFNGALRTELNREHFDLHKAEKHVRLHPVVAKKHLHLTGALRWMKISVVDSESLRKKITSFKANPSEFGQFLLLLDKDNLDKADLKLLETEKNNSIVGIPNNRAEIYDLIKEVSALDRIETHQELSGDSVARKELLERRRVSVERIKHSVSVSIGNAKWYSSESLNGEYCKNISQLCSNLADKIFSHTPRISSELINRDVLSSNSVKARRTLLYKMLESEQREDLGIEGYPAEKGLYLTCLKATQMHQLNPKTGQWAFLKPTLQESTIPLLWEEAMKLINLNDRKRNVSDIYELWKQPPFGVKEGLLPLLFWVFYFANKSKLGLYKDQYYLPNVDEVTLDESLQNISRFELQGIEITKSRKALLEGISKVLRNLNCRVSEAASPLEAARGLVALIRRLPKWTRSTRNFSKETLKLRDELGRASDPHKVIFHDISSIYKISDIDNILEKLQESLSDLVNAYPRMLNELSSLLFKELNDDDVTRLNERASVIKDRASTLAENAFISRMSSFDGSEFALKNVLGAIVEKKTEDWTDFDVITAKNRIAEVCMQFRKLETLAHIHGLENQRESIAVVYATPRKGIIETSIELDKNKRSELAILGAKMLKDLKSSNLPRHEQLSVIISALEQLDEVNDGT